MKGYAKIYKDKKNEKMRKSNNSSLNQSKETIKTSFKIEQSNNIKSPPKNKNKITERNASIITFSNLNANDNQETMKNSENKKKQNNNYNKDNKLINNINISEKKDPMIDFGNNRIKYRKNIEIHNKENSLNFLDENEINGKEKLKQKLIEKENKIQKEKEKNLIKEKLLKTEKEKDKEKGNNKKNKSNSSSLNKSGEKNNYKSNNSKNNSKNKNKINNITKYNKSNDIIIDDEISIQSEGSNNIIYETKYTKSDDNHNNKEYKENINLVKESKEKMLTKEEILYCTHIIFLNNSSFIKKQNKYMMSKSSFLNILKSLNLISSQSILVEIDLIFDSISPKSSMIMYSQFNQLLMKIIQKLYPDKYEISPKLTINYFLNKLINFYNLYFQNKIPKDYLYKYQYNSIVKLLQIFPNENQLFILNEIILTIKEIYKTYFIYELNYKHEDIYKSSENLIKFSKDFEIVPRIINSTQAMTYYNLVIHINEAYNYTLNEMKKFKNFKNKGIIFTLVHFMMFFIHISLYSYTKIFGSKTWSNDENEKIITNEAKLILFLEKLEHSKGMNNFMNLLSTPRNKLLSLVPSKEICSSLGIFDKYQKKVKENKFLDDVFFNDKNKEFKTNKEIEKEEEEFIAD